MQKIERLSLSQVDKERADRTCGPYYYLVTTGAMSFRAFRTKYGFLRWLHARGLQLTKPLVKTGDREFQRIEGHYYEMPLPVREFEELSASKIDGHRVYQLNNGQYVPAIASRDSSDGAVVVSYPWSGIGGEPSIDYWKGVAIEDGVCFKGVSPAPGPDWLLEQPDELVAKAQSLPETSLGEVEKAMLVSSWMRLEEQRRDNPPLNNPAIVNEMICL